MGIDDHPRNQRIGSLELLMPLHSLWRRFGFSKQGRFRPRGWDGRIIEEFDSAELRDRREVEAPARGRSKGVDSAYK